MWRQKSNERRARERDADAAVVARVRAQETYAGLPNACPESRGRRCCWHWGRCWRVRASASRDACDDHKLPRHRTHVYTWRHGKLICNICLWQVCDGMTALCVSSQTVRLCRRRIQSQGKVAVFMPAVSVSSWAFSENTYPSDPTGNTGASRMNTAIWSLPGGNIMARLWSCILDGRPDQAP